MTHIIKCEQINDCCEDLKITAHPDLGYQMFSVSRKTNKAIMTNPSKVSVFLHNVNGTGEKTDKKCVATLDTTEEEKIVRIPINQHTIILSKEGDDSIQIIFTSNSNTEIELTVEKMNQPNLIKTFPTNLNPLIMELRRASKSESSFNAIAFVLQHFFPEPFFQQIIRNPYYDQEIDSKIRKFIIVCLSRIESDIVFEFKKLIDFIDFQMEMGFELSFGIGYFLLSFLNYFSDCPQICSKLIFTNHNFLSFLNLFSFLNDKSIIETLLCFPVPQNCRICKEELSFLFTRILNLNIKFHYSYQILFMEKMTSPSFEVMKLLLDDDRVLDLNILHHSYYFQNLLDTAKKAVCSVSPSVDVECSQSPFSEKLKEERRNNLKTSKVEEFEQNEENNLKIKKVCDIKLRLNRDNKIVKTRFLDKLNIRPNDALVGYSYIYVSIILFCLIVSSVIIWKFS